MKRWLLVDTDEHTDEQMECEVCKDPYYLEPMHAICVRCQRKIAELLDGRIGTSDRDSGTISGLVLRNDTGGVPPAFETSGGFKCVICDNHNYDDGIVCAMCKTDVLAVRKMRME